MKTMMMNRRMQMQRHALKERMCCCYGNMPMMSSDKEKRNQHIINIYKERKKYEKVNIYNSIALRAAS
jgi:hypothetical protein